MDVKIRGLGEHPVATAYKIGSEKILDRAFINLRKNRRTL